MKAFSTIAESTVNATNQFAQVGTPKSLGNLKLLKVFFSEQGISQSFNKSSNTAAESNSTDDKVG